jgi:hypothetical protein
LAESVSSAVPSATRIRLRNTIGKPAARCGHTTAASGEWLTAASSGVDLTDKNIS